MVEVAAAVIEFQGKLLAFQRGSSKYDYISQKFEFPGGKVEGDEDHRLALARELKEELGIDVEVNDFIMTVDHAYPDFKIKMHCFLVHLDYFDGQLFEHSSFAHVNLREADSLDWLEADRPVLRVLKESFCHVFAR
jgi:8-oxo-dGTP diphosphatase